MIKILTPKLYLSSSRSAGKTQSVIFSTLMAAAITSPQINISRSEISVRASPRTVLASVVTTVSILFVLAVLRTTTGVTVPIFTPVLGVLFLSFVPGFLIIGIFDLQPANRIDYFLYCLGTSLVVDMGIALITNLSLYWLGIQNPVSILWMVGGVGLAVVALAVVYDQQATAPFGGTLNFDKHANPVVLGSLLLPFLGAYGGLALTYLNTNIPILILFIIIAATPLLVVFDIVEERYFPLLLWGVGAALLLQNVLTGHYLAWGDAITEGRIVLQVLRQDLWNPPLAASHGNKYGMLRIALLHPVYMLFTGSDIFVEFRVVHPIIFSAMPIALFQLFRKQFSAKVAYLSVFYYMSLFSFFMVLSRNTRTATALLFLASIGILAADRTTPRRIRRMLSIFFAFGIVVSHYGVSYMVFIIFLTAVLVKILSTRVTGKYERGIFPLVFIGFYFTALFGWYLYGTPFGKGFYTFANFTTTFIEKIQETFLASSAESSSAAAQSATTAYATKEWRSITMDILVKLNLGMGLIMVFGLAITGLRALYTRTLEYAHEYMGLALTAMLVFSITFLPVAKFNTARTYAITLLFFAPFFAVGVRELWQGLTRITPIWRPQKQHLNVAISVVLIFYFLLNSGFVSAVATHEYSPNALIDKPDIMEGEATPPQAIYFFKMYPTDTIVNAGIWVRTHAEVNATVRTGRWPGNLGISLQSDYREKEDEFVPIEQKTMPLAERSVGSVTENTSDSDLVRPAGDSEYVFLAPVATRTRTIRFPGEKFGLSYARPENVSLIWANKSRVYSNGDSVVYR